MMPISRRELIAAALAARPSAAQPATLVIDANRHAGLGFSMTGPDTSSAAVEITLRQMDQAGIGRSILSGLANPRYETSNQQIAEICKQYPGKFIGFARHNPAAEKGAVSLLQREIDTLGLKGLLIAGHPTRSLLEMVAGLRIPVLYQNDVLAEIHMAAQEFPQIAFIVSELGIKQGFDAHFEAIAIARRYSNVYLTTGALIGYEYLEIAARELDPQKLIFASNGPEADARVELYRIRLLKLPTAVEAMVLGGNMQRLLPT
jgi:predicted TIM-barrel fold metal-dependent hydrolase